MNKQVVGTIFYNELANIFKSTYFELLLTGSIVLGDYIFQKSNIDFVVFIDGKIADDVEHKIYRLHDMFNITDNILEKLEGVYYEVVDNSIVGGIYIGSTRSNWHRVDDVVHSILEIDILKKHHYKAAETRKDLMKVLPRFISANVIKDFLIHQTKTFAEQNTNINDPQFTTHAVLCALRSIYYLNNNQYCSKTQALKYIQEKFLFNEHSNLFRLLENYLKQRDNNTIIEIKKASAQFTELLYSINQYYDRYYQLGNVVASSNPTEDDPNINEIIIAAQSFLLEQLSQANIDKEEKRYRYEHSLRVTNIGLKLAELENANKKIVVLGCLLHDVGKFDTDDNVEHGRVSARVAKGFLETQELKKEEIEDICYAIAVHVDGKCDYNYEHTLEASIVSDSDNIDRFGAYRIYQQMRWSANNYKGNLNKEKEAIKMRVEKLERYYRSNILETESGNKWFKKQLELQITYFKEYIKEIDITISPVV